MASPPNVVVVVTFAGAPAAGKSSLIRGLIEKVSVAYSGQNAALECHHIEYDEIQENIASQQQTSLEQTTTSSQDLDASLEAWRKSRTVALEKLSMLLQEELSVAATRTSEGRRLVLALLDDNFHLRSMRKQVYQICQRYADRKDSDETLKVSPLTEIYYGLVWVDATLETCIHRNALRSPSRRVSDTTICRILNDLEPPLIDSATWEANGLKLSAEEEEDMETWVEQMFGFVAALLDGQGRSVEAPISPEEELVRLERERAATRASLGHQLDQESRKWIKAVAQIRPKDAKHANGIRKQMLQEKQLDLPINDLAKQFAKRLWEVSKVGWSDIEKDQLLRILLSQSIE